MTKENKLLQLFYAGVLADSVSNYNKAGILGQVTETKLAQQKIAAPAQLKQLEINSPEELFESFSRIFGCIEWNMSKDGNAISACGNSCLLCSIAKKMGTAQPCHIYCINPFRALAEALNPSFSLEVCETLWEGEKCRFVLKAVNPE